MDFAKTGKLKLGGQVIHESSAKTKSSDLVVRDWPGQFVCQPKGNQSRFTDYHETKKLALESRRTK